jgi:hypothetical protein
VRGCDCKWLGLLGIASRERIAFPISDRLMVTFVAARWELALEG